MEWNGPCSFRTRWFLAQSLLLNNNYASEASCGRRNAPAVERFVGGMIVCITNAMRATKRPWNKVRYGSFGLILSHMTAPGLDEESEPGHSFLSVAVWSSYRW
jgi:hypothetical protein